MTDLAQKMTNRRFISSEYAERIEVISQNLKNAVTSIQISNWLQNFEDHEWEQALIVLESLKYFTIQDIVYEFDENLKSILASVPRDKPIYVHGLGDFGKSGSTMIYFLKQTPAFKQNENRFKILSHTIKLKSQGLKSDDHLILVDDIIGSGKTLTTYFDQNIKYQLVKENVLINVSILCIVYMIDCLKIVNGRIVNSTIYGTPYKKAFSSTGSVFGYRPKMLKMRQFCYDYGIRLFSKYDRDLKEDVPHPLGFNGSQALVVFAHSAPNNTLPIIWSSKRDWYPLFPRAGAGKISLAKEFREETRYWVSIAFELGLIKTANPEKKILYNETNYKLLAVMRLKRRGSVDPLICQILGVSASEFKEIMKEGVQHGVFEESGVLSTKGQEIYEEVRKKVKISRTKERRKELSINTNRTYVPQIFSGRT